MVPKLLKFTNLILMLLNFFFFNSFFFSEFYKYWINSIDIDEWKPFVCVRKTKSIQPMRNGHWPFSVAKRDRNANRKSWANFAPWSTRSWAKIDILSSNDENLIIARVKYIHFPTIFRSPFLFQNSAKISVATFIETFKSIPTELIIKWRKKIVMNVENSWRISTTKKKMRIQNKSS